MADEKEPSEVASITSARPSSVVNAKVVEAVAVKVGDGHRIGKCSPDETPLPAVVITGLAKVPSPLPT